MQIGMKLIRQTKLHFKSEKSDKVYEVDLCEAGDGEFIVNFRYGRRGTNLREGTKTPFPESRAKAEDIFESLVQSKTNKGYQLTEETSGMPAPTEPTTASAPVATGPADADPRIEALLQLLRRAVAGEPTESTWRVSRAIWTAGAWFVEDAAPLIAELALRSNDEMLWWSAAWALGRCGSAAQIATLDSLALKGEPDSSLRRIAFLAKLAVVDDATRDSLTANEIAKLPPSVQEAIAAEDVAKLAAATRDHLTGDAGRYLGATLYGVAMSRPWIREAIHEVVSSVAVDDTSMRFMRQTFKAVEMTMDAELFGALVKKFETSPGRGGPKWVYRDRQWTMSKAPAFSSKTKQYFQRRFVRHLRRAGESGRPEFFIPLATGVLLANDDEVQQPTEYIQTEWFWDWERRQYDERRRVAPRYSLQYTFHWVLHSAGQRLEASGSAQRWWYATSPDAADVREEPFKELWDQAPDAIAHILRYARSQEAQRFAGRVWRANPSFADEVDAKFVGDLLGSWFDGTIEIGLELARNLWDPASPDVELLLAVLDARLDEARAVGLQWLDAVEPAVRHNATFLAGLAFMRHADAQERARALAKAAGLPREAQQTLVALVVSALVSMTEPEDEAVCSHASDFILLIAGDMIGELHLDHITALLTHPLEAGQQLGAHALLRRPSLDSLPDAALLAPLSSPFASVRRLGMQMLQRLSDEQLAARAELVAGFGTSEQPEIRQEARPLIERLARANREFAEQLVEQWYPLILREEPYEGLHADVYEMLVGPLSDSLSVIPSGAFRRMLTLKYGFAHLLGFALLQQQTTYADESLPTVVGWGDHPLLVLRQAVRTHFDSEPQRLIEAPGEVTRLLESDWDDARDWAFEFCRNVIPEDAWDPDGLVVVCDSVKPRVQAFGREMVTRRFRNEDGPLYLQRLSEHPTSDLQVFATNYLARFASGKPDTIVGLDLYFRVVLSRIGAGRVAKDRVLTFLADEAAQSEEVAAYVEALLRRQVATVAIGDKATCIRILAQIRRDWPNVPNAVERKPPTVFRPEAN